MSANSTISFTEAFGALSIDPAAARSENYADAVSAAERALGERFKALSEADFECVSVGEFKSAGSGFGWLDGQVENRALSNIVTFPEISTGECAEFYTLYKTGSLPEHSVTEPPMAFVVGEGWKKLLLAAPPSWYRSYHLGVVSYAAGDIDGAKRFYEDSLAMKESPYAYRDLAMLARNYGGDVISAVTLMRKAFALLPTDRNLAVDYAETLISAGMHREWLDIYENNLIDSLRAGRLQMLAALSYTELSEPELAVRALTENFLMPDLKEGEFSVFAIWLKAHAEIMRREGKTDISEASILAEYPLPYELDFRMH